MKKPQSAEGRGSRIESQPATAPSLSVPRPSSLVPRHAFTLIELLVVIAIMGVLASLILPVARGVKRHQYIYNTRAELAQLETAIDRYKAAYGFYPPDNPRDPTFNQLYYELTGTTNANPGGAPIYRPIAGGPDLTADEVTNSFNVGGFVNCSRSAGEESVMARNFLPDLKPKQFDTVSNFNNTVSVRLLLGSVGGPDQNYQPFGVSDKNPWRYRSSNPTNNPAAYDLWMQLVISGKTNLICNWSKQTQINSPLP